ncbi:MULTISPECIES: LON peptidase substrate-binding domain-containing protein [Roseobacteraceae]|uniref:LON peptidase substrate-binding domain-containing protein n=1 Tax=Roseobacteraceae TaxID=2854170 RepID=UPI00125F32CF|nr:MULTISPECIES: LON peptidase substrate-binding domain-containing protein [Roseobacteraceae]KAB6714754.1 ATP-dependent protease [Roseobacter sp. TSBP12]|tara:strand:+ start:6672 stop:7307 length:636 start_codon:yes stop_codon:yes gene_type:complete
MITAADLPKTIAIFPLTGALLLPRSRLPLHIFEPRYLQMIEDCMKTPTRLIGMVQPRSGAGEGKLNSIGCAGRLTGFSETEDGRYMITLSGISRFRLGPESTGFSPYRKFDVHWADFAADLGPAEHDPCLDRRHFISLLRRYFDEEDLRTDWENLGRAEDELLINSLSMLCPFGCEDKQALLEAPSLSTRRETLITLIEFALRGGNNEDMM